MDTSLTSVADFKYLEMNKNNYKKMHNNINLKIADRNMGIIKMFLHQYSSYK